MGGARVIAGVSESGTCSAAILPDAQPEIVRFSFKSLDASEGVHVSVGNPRSIMAPGHNSCQTLSERKAQV